LAVLKVSHLKTQPEMTIADKQKRAAVATTETRVGDVDTQVEMRIPKTGALRVTQRIDHIDHIADVQEALLRSNIERQKNMMHCLHRDPVISTIT
jgi:hypothetical protein